jgi:rubrerythrin
MTQATIQEKSVGQSPVDDATYNLMQALTSKLEAIEAYETYREDGDDTDRELFEDLLREERQHADRLLAALRTRMR